MTSRSFYLVNAVIKHFRRGPINDLSYVFSLPLNGYFYPGPHSSLDQCTIKNVSCNINHYFARTGRMQLVIVLNSQSFDSKFTSKSIARCCGQNTVNIL